LVHDALLEGFEIFLGVYSNRILEQLARGGDIWMGSQKHKSKCRNRPCGSAKRFEILSWDGPMQLLWIGYNHVTLFMEPLIKSATNRVADKNGSGRFAQQQGSDKSRHVWRMTLQWMRKHEQ
jgi:hypothetical protein